MYNIDYKQVKKTGNFFLIFLVIGIVILGIMGAVFTSIFTSTKDYKGTVITYKVESSCHDEDDATLCAPIFYYRVNGINYKYKSSISSSKHITKGIIYYDINNPENATSDYDKNNRLFFLLFLLIPIVFIGLGIFGVIKNKRVINRLKKLEATGTLYKNLSYQMVDSNISVNNTKLKAIKVEFTLPNGEMRTFIGNPRFDHKYSDEDGTVDLLVDIDDPDNFYLDFNIN